MQPVLIVIWICGVIGVAIVVARLVLGRIHKVKWDVGDSLSVFALLILVARLPVLHVIMMYRTNNVPQVYRDTNDWTSEEIHRREIGAKFMIAVRCLYICGLWTLKLVLLCFYQHLVQDMPWGNKVIRIFVVIFAATWAASIISTFVECRPFELYWQVLPNPGTCVQAVKQLFIVGVTNVVTDIMLILLPIPILVNIRLSMKKKLQLALLFSIGLVLVIITAIRLPFTLRSRLRIEVRLLWTSIEMLAAVFVSNAPKIYGLKKVVRRRRESVVREARARSPSKKLPHLQAVYTDDLERDSEHRESVGIYHIEDISNYGNHGVRAYHEKDMDEAALVCEKVSSTLSTQSTTASKSTDSTLT